MRGRWLSQRAVLLHLAVVVVVPGCLAAAWWQANAALGGNALSWAYSVEWPIFAVVAVAAWWHLIHEDPAAYAARRAGPTEPAPAEAPARLERRAIPRSAARHARRLCLGVGLEAALGMVALALVPFDRRTGWIPASGAPAYLPHALFGLALVPGSLVFLHRARGQSGLLQAMAWIGLGGVVLAGAGGILTVDRSLVRFFGMCVMFVGTATALLGYATPWALAHQAEIDPAPDGPAPRLSETPSGSPA